MSDLKKKIFGMRDIYNFKVYFQDELEFEIDYASNAIIRRNDDFNSLLIENALIDFEVMENILNGKYDGKFLRLEAVSVARDAETGKDYVVNITFNKAQLYFYEKTTPCDDVVAPIMKFSFPTYKGNVEISVIGDEEEK